MVPAPDDDEGKSNKTILDKTTQAEEIKPENFLYIDLPGRFN